MVNKQLTREGLAKFYNDYKIINFSDQKTMKSKEKILKKQMGDLVNFVLPCLAKLGENDPDMPVGMVLASLVSDNLVSKKKFIDVQNNLKEMKELGTLLNFDRKLTGILNALVP